MTPKQKADKLCIDFLMKPNTTDIRFYMDKQLAKQCALIAVDEILEAIDWHAYEAPNKEICFWEQLKTETEKL